MFVIFHRNLIKVVDLENLDKYDAVKTSHMTEKYQVFSFSMNFGQESILSLRLRSNSIQPENTCFHV